MLHWEIIAVCSQIHTKHKYKLFGQKLKLLNENFVVNNVTTAFICLSA